MKKLTLITIFVIIIITTAILSRYVFLSIEMGNKPYLTNRQQFTEIFYSNISRFEQIVQAADIESDILFQYNSNFGDEQVYDKFGHGEFSDTMLFLINDLGITNFQKSKGEQYFLIYQYAPVVGSDIYIGVRFNYLKEEWEYYYYHNYAMCRHSNKYIYWIYDHIFNQKSVL